MSTLSLLGVEDDISLSVENLKNRFNDSVGKALEEEFSKLKNMKAREIKRQTLDGLRIRKIIEDALGIEFNFGLFGGENAGVPYKDFSVRTDAVLRPTDQYAITTNGNKLIKRKNKIEIAVDKVSGYISGIKGIKHTIYMGKALLVKGKYTAREALAVFLHELGHIWTYYLTLPHIHITNFIAGEFANKFAGIESKETRTTLLNDVSEEFKLDIIERERLLASRDKSEVAVLMYTTQLNQLKSLMGNNPYDKRNSEAMADQFVVRWGYGKDLASGFAKDKGMSMGTKNYSWSKAIWHAMDAVVFVLPGAIPFLILMSAATLFQEDEKYDSPVKRVEVVKQGLIDRLKDAHTDEDKEIILREVKYIDNYLKEHSDLKSLFTIFTETLIPWGRSAKRHINFQKALESLQNNNLSVDAERLRNLL